MAQVQTEFLKVAILGDNSEPMDAAKFQISRSDAELNPAAWTWDEPG